MSNLTRCFEQLKVAEHFGTPDMGEAYFRGLGYVGFMGQVDEMNAAIRDLAKWPLDKGLRDNMTIVDVPGVSHDRPVGGVLYVPPSHEHVDELHKAAFETAQSLPDINDAADLLYLSHNLTQRYWNGNLRTAAVVRSLLRVGYGGSYLGRDGSRSARRFYNTLAEGRHGVRKLGVEMDLTHLQRSFALHDIEDIQQSYDYDGIIPRGVGRFTIRRLQHVQPDMAPHNTRHTGHLFAEPFMNVPLGMRFMLSAGMNVMNYLRSSPSGYLIDVPRLVKDIPLRDIGTLHGQDHMRKRVFLNSVIGAFSGMNVMYGRDHKEVLAQLQPRPQPTGN